MAQQLSPAELAKINQLISDLNNALQKVGQTSSLAGQSAQDLADYFGSAAGAASAINNELDKLGVVTQGLNDTFADIVNQMKLIAGSGISQRTLQSQINTLADKLLIAKKQEQTLSKEELATLKKKIELRLADKNLTDKQKEDLEYVLQMTKEMTKEMTRQQTKQDLLKKGMGKLTDALGPSAVWKMFKEILFAADKDITSIAKGLNKTYAEANAVYSRMQAIATSTGDFAVRASTLTKTLVEINQSLGISVELGEKQLVFMTKLRERAGFTAEEINKMYLLTAATAQDQEKFTASFLASARIASNRAGIALNEKKLLQDTLNISKAMQLSFGGNADALAKAAVEAKKVGVSMEKLEGIASSLLDFESSISAELEAEVLTGRNLNLELARVYAINNDIEGLSREIGKNYGSIDNFLNSNRLQQEAMAKAVGMTREELAGSLLEAKAIGNATGEEAERRKALYDFAKQKYGEEEAAKQLAEGQLETLENQMGVQERFEASMEKVKDIFSKIVSGPLLGMLNSLAKALENTAALKALAVGLGVTMAAIAFNAIMTATALSGGAILGALAVAGALYGASMLPGVSAEEPAQPVGDVYDPPSMSNKNRIIDLGVGKKLKVNPQDAIVAGPETRGQRTTTGGPSRTDQLLERLITVTSNKQFLIDTQRFGSIASTSNYSVGGAYS